MVPAESLVIAERLNAELKREVVPQAPTLYELEESLAALLDTEALVTPEQEKEFQAQLAHTMTAAVAKRDRVAEFIRHCEAQAAMARNERQRLTEREHFFLRAAERMRLYVQRILEGLGKAKPKLEGKTSTFSLRACPASVEIVDEAAVPAKYKTLTITVPADVWNRMYADTPRWFLEAIRVECTVSKTAVKKAIDAGETVPGADLSLGRNTLVVK